MVVERGLGPRRVTAPEDGGRNDRSGKQSQSVGSIKALIGAWTLPPGEVLMTRPRYSVYVRALLSFHRHRARDTGSTTVVPDP